MKAILWTKYGPPDGLRLGDVSEPVPSDDEVLVRIHAATVTAGDCEMRRLQLPLMLSLPMRLYAGLIKPKRIRILGQEFAGEVVSVGRNVTTYTVGDRIFGTTGFGFGAYAEYICIPERPGDAQAIVAPLPTNLSYFQAAVLPTAGLEALHYLRSANVKAGDKVLIIGAGGSIGTMVIQLARYSGAEVTGVDSTAKLDLMRSLGAQHVIDYTAEDYTKRPESYDLIVDVVGRKGIRQRLRLLKPGGHYFLAYARFRDLLRSVWLSMTGDKHLHIDASKQRVEDLRHLRDRVEAGDLVPVVDRIFPLEQTADAHRYAESGQKTGNIAIAVVAEHA